MKLEKLNQKKFEPLDAQIMKSIKGGARGSATDVSLNSGPGNLPYGSHSVSGSSGKVIASDGSVTCFADSCDDHGQVIARKPTVCPSS